ncbi:EAL domain-containing protein [Noviherbaspirillum sp. 17J57-3]|uniref:EAL domain-containing protein n=2 Tax=Noviherbaspirillum galbum TaxID=2709383 RepID=A0A6B3SSW2_9BURK|nr:EAL domain-containing protein [Noviherbaspirillum galbum]
MARAFLPAQQAFSPESGLLSHLLANFDGLVYRCLADSNWTMQFLSEGCMGLTGYLPGDFIANATISYEELIHPDDRSRVRDIIFDALRRNERFSLEYRIVRRDGAVRWVWERGTGIRDAHGACFALEGYVQDITQRKAAEDALQEAERRYRSIFENAIEGIFQSTSDKGYLAVNPALARIYGYDSPQQMIDTLRDLDRQLYVDPQRRVDFLQHMNGQGAVINFESQVYQRNGNVIWISENARAVRGPDDAILFFEGSVVDITERKAYEAKIRFQATHDALTGLPNRNLLRDRLEQALLNARRGKHLAAVAFIDLDQFKFVNDSLGHELGDELLKMIAGRLRSCMRAADTVARQGGDEFVIVLGNHKDCKTVEDTIGRVIEAVSRPWMARDLELRITCSVGIAVYPNDGDNAETLLRHADSAMYKAKELGRNNFQYFSADMNQDATERLGTLNALRQALANDEFVLHYQPKINLLTGAVVGAEALVRWRSPARGMVTPNDFIPLAEESGLIIDIGAWVLRTACAQAMAWRQEGHGGRDALMVSVNLSPSQLMRDDIVDVVAGVLAATGLPPRLLELEITETVVMRDIEKSLDKLARLKMLGIRISIDDFGTGHSSLNYLKRLPVDILKIDRSFVNDIATDEDDAAIVKAIISLARILNLDVVAEGVETEAQRRFLMENGCDVGQGYHFSRPLPAAAFASAWLALPGETAGTGRLAPAR